MAMQRLQTTGEIAVNTFKQYLTACVLLSLTLSTLLCFPHDIHAQKESTVLSTGGIQNTNCKPSTSAFDLPRSGGTDGPQSLLQMLLVDWQITAQKSLPRKRNSMNSEDYDRSHMRATDRCLI